MYWLPQLEIIEYFLVSSEYVVPSSFVANRVKKVLCLILLGRWCFWFNFLFCCNYFGWSSVLLFLPKITFQSWKGKLIWSIASCCSSRAGSGTPYMFCTPVLYPPFPEVVTAFLCLRWDLWKNILNCAHVFWSVAWRLHSLMSLLQIAICSRKVIPFDTIVASEIVCPPARVNPFPFSNCFINQYRGSAGS